VREFRIIYTQNPAHVGRVNYTVTIGKCFDE
jgi:hypothetical protein